MLRVLLIVLLVAALTVAIPTPKQLWMQGNLNGLVYDASISGDFVYAVGANVSTLNIPSVRSSMALPLRFVSALYRFLRAVVSPSPLFLPCI